jgi:FtsZ-interacting cell division protein ZipA
MDNPLVLVLAIALIAVIAVAVWLYMQKRRTDELRTSFGPEYDRAVQEQRDPRRAERVLEERKERVEQLHIRSLPAEDRDRFAERWRSVQAQFVDDPKGATSEADRLADERRPRQHATDLLSQRGVRPRGLRPPLARRHGGLPPSPRRVDGRARDLQHPAHSRQAVATLHGG